MIDRSGFLLVFSDQTSQQPELQDLGGFRRLELCGQRRFEVGVAVVDVALNKFHQVEQQPVVALLQTAFAGNLGDRQCKTEQQLRSHRQGLAEVVVAENQWIEQAQWVPDAAVPVGDRFWSRWVGEEPGFGNPGAFRDAPGEIGRQGDDPVLDVAQQALGAAEPTGEMPDLGETVPLVARELGERLANPPDRVDWWLGLDEGI